MEHIGDHPAIRCAMDTGFAPWELPHHVGRCAGCGEVICDGESAFCADDGKLVHGECFLEYVLDRYGVEAIGDALGYERVG